MNLSQFFGDDEHTAVDGAYPRMLKSRKWLYLAAAVGLAHAEGAIRYDKLARATGDILNIAPQHAWWALAAGLLLIALQYLLLIVQLCFAYPPLLVERLQKRTKAEFDVLETELTARRINLDAAQKTLDEAQFDLEAGQRRVQELKDGFRADGPADESPMSPGQMSMLMEIDSAKNAAEERTAVRDMRAAAVAAASLAVAQVLAERDTLRRRTPERRRLYELSEFSIDILRLAPPLVFAAFALNRLMT